jgi:hypothetical protein
MFFCTVHCNIIVYYNPTKCTFNWYFNFYDVLNCLYRWRVNKLYHTFTYNRISEDEPSGSKHVEDTVKIKTLFNQVHFSGVYDYTKFVVLHSKPASYSDATEFEYWPGYLVGFYTVSQSLL